MNRGKWFARGCGTPLAMPGWGTRRGMLNYQILVSNSFSDEKRVYPGSKGKGSRRRDRRCCHAPEE
jgi:hypothetical protein